MSHTQLLQTTLSNLQAHGGSLTPIRQAILEVLAQASQPLTARDILNQLTHTTAHRATVYRDIEYCLKHNIITSYAFKDHAVLYYELTTDHHHHLICESCGTITNIYPQDIETKIDQFTKQLKTTNQFHITTHRLKFYGQCPQCHSGNPQSNTYTH